MHFKPTVLCPWCKNTVHKFDITSHLQDNCNIVCSSDPQDEHSATDDVLTTVHQEDFCSCDHFAALECEDERILCDSCILPVTNFEAILASPDALSRGHHAISYPSCDTVEGDRTATYRYADLREPGDFRILVLHPAKLHEAVCCSIIHMNIACPPPFEAVSYTWADANGNSERCSTIMCGRRKKPLHITANCEAVLRRFRLPDVKRFLWVDAICIDQENVEERSVQVGLMSSIYSRARRVLIYLGEAFENSNELFDFLRMSHVEMDSGTQTYETKLLQRCRSGLRPWDLRSCPPESATAHTHCQGLWKLRFGMLRQATRTLLSKPWFMRIWVLQEAVMAQEALVTCGDRSIPWEWISLLELNLANLPTWDLHGTIPCVLRRVPCDHREDFLTLLEDSRTCKSSDRRDKIFALLGFLDQDDSLPLAAGYTKSAEDVFSEVAQHLISRYGTTSALANIGNPNTFSVLPSWAPDWSMPVNIRRFHVRSKGHGEQNPELSAIKFVKTGDRRVALQVQATKVCLIMHVQNSGLSISRLDNAFSPALTNTLTPTWIYRIIHGEYTDPDNYASGLDLILNEFRRTTHVWGLLYAQTPLWGRVMRLVLGMTTPPYEDGHDTIPCTPMDRWIEWNLFNKCRCQWRDFLVSSRKMGSMRDGRGIFLSQNWFGLGPESAESGDEVFQLPGSECLYVLRRYKDGYKIVGDCWLSDFTEEDCSCVSPLILSPQKADDPRQNPEGHEETILIY